MKSFVAAAALLSGVVALGACAPSTSAGAVPRAQANTAAQVYLGTVLAAVPVRIEGTQTGVGAATGAVLGGIAGSEIGGGRRENVAAGVAGAVVGGLIGNAVERGVTQGQGVQYTIRLDNGQTLAITQAADVIIPVNARVQVIYYPDGRATVTQIAR